MFHIFDIESWKFKKVQTIDNSKDYFYFECDGEDFSVEKQTSPHTYTLVQIPTIKPNCIVVRNIHLLSFVKSLNEPQHNGMEYTFESKEGQKCFYSPKIVLKDIDSIKNYIEENVELFA